MTTEEEIRRRARFGERWAHLLTKAATCAHFYVHHAHEVDDWAAAEALGRIRAAAWSFSELERNEGPEIGDHLGRLVALLCPGLAAVRAAALAFAATPGEKTLTKLLYTVRVGFRAPTAVFDVNASPFQDDAEAHAWAHHRPAAN